MDSTSQSFPILPPDIPLGYCYEPSNLVAVVNGDLVTFSWTSPHDNDGFYLITKKEGFAEVITTVFGSGTQIKLASNTLHTWSVQTMCDRLFPRGSAVVDGAPFITGNATPNCAKVDNSNSLIIQSANSTRLQWTKLAGIDEYRIEYQPANVLDAYSVVLSTNDNFIYLDFLISNTNYKWRIMPVCENAEFSDWSYFTSSAGSGCPPVEIKGMVSVTSGVFYWTERESAESYRVYVNGSVISLKHPVNILTLSNLTQQTKYNIIVIPNCKNGIGSLTGDIATMEFETLKEPVNNPTSLQAAQDGYNALVITWVPAPGIDSQELMINGSKISLANTINTYTINKPIPNTKYNILLRSVTGEYKSTGIFAFVEINDYCFPVESIVTKEKDHQSITFAWPSVPGVNQYSVVYKVDGDPTFSDPVIVTDTEYKIDAAFSNTSYVIRVTSNCGIDISDYIEYTDATLPLPQCPVAFNLKATQVEATSLLLSFDISDNETEGNFKADVTFMDDPFATVYGTESPILITGLLPDNVFEIIITNNCSTSPSISNKLTVRTPNACTAPTILTTSLITDNTVLSASWNAVPDVINYGIEYRKIGAVDWQTLPDQAGLSFTTPADSSMYEVKITSIYDGRRCSSTAITDVPKVLNVLNNNLNPDTVINWTPISGISYYKVVITALAEDTREQHVVVSTALSFLSKSKEYSVVVTAVYNDIEGTPSDALVYTTNANEYYQPSCIPAEFTAFFQDSHINDPATTISTLVDIAITIADYDNLIRYKVELLATDETVVPIATKNIEVSEPLIDGLITFMKQPIPASEYIARVTWFSPAGIACSSEKPVLDSVTPP